MTDVRMIDSDGQFRQRGKKKQSKEDLKRIAISAIIYDTIVTIERECEITPLAFEVPVGIPDKGGVATAVDICGSTKNSNHLAVVEFKVGMEIKRKGCGTMKNLPKSFPRIPNNPHNAALLQLACTVGMLKENGIEKVTPFLIVANNDGTKSCSIPGWVKHGVVPQKP